jgi:hypothetical protein
MHNIEPFYNWIKLYSSQNDSRSPFFGREYSEFEFSQTIYNYYIHPQWDFFGSNTLYIKIIFIDYETGYAIIEMIGEWNDAINNDIMWLKREVIEMLAEEGIDKYILIGENVLNFHSSDDCYYEEWFEETEEGWIAAINFREQVHSEWRQIGIDNYIVYGGELDEIGWRTMSPNQLYTLINKIITYRLN